MKGQNLYFLLVALALAVPPFWAWRTMDHARDRAQSTFNQLESTRTAVQSIVRARADAPADVSGSFGQADAVRLVNSALAEAGLSPSTASELSLRDDAIRKDGQESGRLQRLSIRLQPIETVQLGRTLEELSQALPSFTPAEISIQRPSGLEESDTRYSVDLAFEREYVSNAEGER